MRRIIALLLIILLLLSCSACTGATESVHNNLSMTKTYSEKDDYKEDDTLILPGGPGQGDTGAKKPENKEPDEALTKSAIYPPSIFVIEASGKWRQELAPGYFADYEFEFYADKLDELDNQTASGNYTGVFWMKVTLDTGEFLNDLLKDVPVDMQFNAGGEGVCDFFSVILMNGFERESMGGSYDIPNTDGSPLVPTGDTLAARGSFIAEAVEAYLDVNAKGAAGETVEHHDSSASGTEVEFILHVEPDPDYSATERKVTLYLSSADGMSATLDGILRRLPGYTEDLQAYTSQGKRGEILDKHLQNTN